MHRLAFAIALVLTVSASQASAQRFVEVARMSPGLVPGTAPGYGVSVALDGTTAVVGAPGAGAGTGAIYVYDVSGGAARLLTTLTSTGSLGLGTAVAVRGSVIVAGAPRTPVESRGDVGAVIVYQRSGDTVTQVQRFGPSDSNSDGGALFGQALAFAGPTHVLVGAPGIQSAFLFSGITTVPTEMSSVSGTVAGYAGALAVGAFVGGTAIAAVGSGDPSVAADVDVWAVTSTGVAVTGVIENGGGLAGFGSALAIDGARVAVGVPGSADVKIYLVDAASGTATGIEAYDGPPGSGFGASVALHGEVAFGGAPAAGALFGDAGEAYALRPDTLFPLRPAIRTTRPFVQGLGTSMSLSGSFLLVGAPGIGDAILFGDGTALPCTVTTDCPIAETCIDGVCCQSACSDDPTDCETCASDRARGWCVLAEVGTECSSAEGTCTGTCSGESAVCEMLECADGGAIDAGSEDAGAFDASTTTPDGAAATPNVSFGGGGGCRCAAVGARGGASSRAPLALALLAIVIAGRRRRDRIG